MIQRIQSLWLLLASACAFASFKFPYYSGTNAKGLSPYELNATENFLLLFTTAIVGGLALFTIFLFKKRTLQLRLCVLGILLEAILIFLYYREVKTFTLGTYSLTAILHSIIVLAFVLAARAINKDEKLVKDSDRLR
jgi:peptidoglycan/LPS O-acetylase OafA/YrhL